MTSVIVAYVLAVICMGLCIFGARRLSPLLNLVTFPLVALAVLFFGAHSLGRAIPSQFLMGMDMHVSSIVYDQGKAIYVFGIPAGGGEPVLVKLPWSAQDAEDAAKKKAQGPIDMHLGKNKSQLPGGGTNNGSSDDDGKFSPAKGLPEKDGE